MRSKPVLSLDLFGDRLCPESGLDDGGEHRKMLRVLTKAARGELTGRQLECLRLRYGEGKGVSEIAELLGIAPSTASKHLKKARARLKKIMLYYFNRLEA